MHILRTDGAIIEAIYVRTSTYMYESLELRL